MELHVSPAERPCLGTGRQAVAHNLDGSQVRQGVTLRPLCSLSLASPVMAVPENPGSGPHCGQGLGGELGSLPPGMPMIGAKAFHGEPGQRLLGGVRLAVQAVAGGDSGQVVRAMASVRPCCSIRSSMTLAMLLVLQRQLVPRGS